MRTMRALAAAVLTGLAAATLAACGSSTPEVDLPDLAELGLAMVDCDDTVQMAGLSTQEPAAELECWTGTLEDGLVETADGILAEITAANPDAEDVSGALCWEDTVTDAEASACRAVLIGTLEDGTIVSAIAALKDPASAIGDLSDEPTDAEVEQALAGAEVEVLVFSEPASAETGDL